jgi:ubiquinone/menaquinone biosynthesis C-methylase UbiE
MIEENKTVLDFYQNYDEDNRMNSNPLAFIRCKEIISRYLSSESMSILDCGGATGVFSFWLANQGHKVSLIDFVPKHIEIAKEHENVGGARLASITIGDARDLPYEDATFDLVLLMGLLYHLTEKAARIKSLKEAFRVLKPNGKIICEVISRFASI